MPLQTLDGYSKLIANLEDQPTMAASELKAYWDSSPEEIRVAFNKAIAVLRSITDGDSGADNIGATKIKDVDGETVQTILESLKVLIDKKVGTTDIFTKRELESTTDGSSGASKIKTSPISGLSGDNVQAFFKSLKDTIDQLALNQIPDGSITLDKLNDNIKDLFNKVGLVNKDVAQIMLNTDAKDRVTEGATFGTSFETSFGMEIDNFKSFSESQLGVGTTEITLDSVDGLSVGKEVTIFDDVNLERKTIEAINGKVITIPPLEKEYKKQTNIVRSMAIIDTTNKCLKFGGWNWDQLMERVDGTVIDQPYSSEGNGSRKLVRLSNGWLVAAVRNSTSEIRFYVDKQDGNGFVLLGYKSDNFTKGYSITSNGTMIYVAGSRADNLISFYKFNSLEANGTSITTLSSFKFVVVDSAQTAIGSVSMEFDRSTGTLHVAWVSKNQTYPNSFNVRYSKSLDTGNTWSTIEQVSKRNEAGKDIIEPSIGIINGEPFILVSDIYDKCIYVLKKSGLGVDVNYSWTIRRIHNQTSYVQSAPSSVVIGGIIHVVWYGADNNNQVDNIRYSKTIDEGLTWNAEEKLTNAVKPQRYPSITANGSDSLFVVWAGITTETVDAFGIRSIEFNQGVWGGISDISGSPGVNITYPSTLFDSELKVIKPIFICTDYKSNKVGFYGSWYKPTFTKLLENDVRFTTNDTTQIAAWIDHDYGLSIDGFWNGIEMESSTKDITTQSQETQIQSDITARQVSEVKLILRRDLITDDLKITRILGGVD